MWPAALITASAAAFGRLFVAGILPSAVLTTTLWLLLQANAFNPRTRGLNVGDVIPPNFGPDKGSSILLLLLAMVLFAVVLQGFQLGILRLLEGYWGASPLSVILSAPGVNRHQNRQNKALKEWAELYTGKLPSSKTPSEPRAARRVNDQVAQHRHALRQRLRMQRARLRIEAYPPKQDDLMPTRLGNALRSGERRAGERYGWSTIHAWPRLLLGLPEPTAAAYRYVRDSLDAAAIFCFIFLIDTILAGVAFLDDPALWWVPLALLIISYTFYRAAVVAAMTHGTVLQAAFDRNRFELFEALHQPLPETPEEEYDRAIRISQFFAEGHFDPELAYADLGTYRYSHAGPESKRWLRWLRPGKRSVPLDYNPAQHTAGPQS